MTTIGVIAVRLGSSRLPEKALLPILGKPMLERMIERVARATTLDHIVIATTTLKEDDKLEALADTLGVGIYRGPVDDVLGRIAGAVERIGADVCVELLGDNPLIHADLIDDVVRFRDQHGYDYASNVTAEHPHAPAGVARFPIGVRAEAYTAQTIHRAAGEATTAYHRENTTTYIWQNPDTFKLGYVEATGRWSDLNRPDVTFAVNYREDYEMVKDIYAALHPKDPDFTLNDVIQHFDANPRLADWMGGHTRDSNHPFMLDELERFQARTSRSTFSR